MIEDLNELLDGPFAVAIGVLVVIGLTAWAVYECLT
jgi:hypothetical protein